MTPIIAAAEEKQIQVVSDSLLEDVKIEGILSQIKNKTICEWGSDVS